MKRIISIDLAGQSLGGNPNAHPPFTPHVDWVTNVPVDFLKINNEQQASNAGQIPPPNPPAAPAPPAPGAKFRYRRDTQAICPVSFTTATSGKVTTAPPAPTPSCEHQDQTVSQPFYLLPFMRLVFRLEF